MARAARLSRLLLLAGGGILLAAGAAVAAAGIALPERVHALLPQVAVDTPAIGGAMVALGVGVGVAGLTEVLVGLALGRRDWASAAGVVALGLLAMLLLALAATILTEIAAGAAAWLLAPAGVLVAIAGVHGAAAWRLAAASFPRSGGSRGPG